MCVSECVSSGGVQEPVAQCGCVCGCRFSSQKPMWWVRWGLHNAESFVTRTKTLTKSSMIWVVDAPTFLILLVDPWNVPLLALKTLDFFSKCDVAVMQPDSHWWDNHQCCFLNESSALTGRPAVFWQQEKVELIQNRLVALNNLDFDIWIWLQSYILLNMSSAGHKHVHFWWRPQPAKWEGKWREICAKSNMWVRLLWRPLWETGEEPNFPIVAAAASHFSANEPIHHLKIAI